MHITHSYIISGNSRYMFSDLLLLLFSTSALNLIRNTKHPTLFHIFGRFVSVSYFFRLFVLLHSLYFNRLFAMALLMEVAMSSERNELNQTEKFHNDKCFVYYLHFMHLVTVISEVEIERSRFC